MTYAAGVDVGSTQTKAVIVDEDCSIVGRSLLDTGANVAKAAESAYASAPRRETSKSVRSSSSSALGYGRYRVTFGNTQVTESCFATAGGRSICSPTPGQCSTWGGQDTKAISVTADGEISDFCMNDKCVPPVLDVSSEQRQPRREPGVERPRADLALVGAADQPAPPARSLPNPRCWHGSARARRSEDILWGVQMSIASRSGGPDAPGGHHRRGDTFTGGVSLNVGMVKALGERLEKLLQHQRGLPLHGGAGGGLVRPRSRGVGPRSYQARSRGDVMTVTAGIDVGSTYTKVGIHDGETILAKTMSPTDSGSGRSPPRPFGSCDRRVWDGAG